MRYEKLLNKRPTPNVDTPSAVAILSAAEQLFLEKGYVAVTTREIAALAEVNLGLIPYYFVSKENLAQIVFQRIKNRAFEHGDLVDLAELNCAERMYVQTMISWRAMENTEPQTTLRFYYEFLLETKGNCYVSDNFEDLAWSVIREYGRDISLAENEMYLTAVAGAEQMLVIRMLNHELNIDYEDVLDLVISNYFYNIGLSDQTIAAIILRSKKFLETHG